MEERTGAVVGWSGSVDNKWQVGSTIPFKHNVVLQTVVGRLQHTYTRENLDCPRSEDVLVDKPTTTLWKKITIFRYRKVGRSERERRERVVLTAKCWFRSVENLQADTHTRTHNGSASWAPPPENPHSQACHSPHAQGSQAHDILSV